MREYERRRSDLENAAYDVGDARNGEDEERAEAVAAMARKDLDAHVRGLVDALAKYESIREQMEERGYVYVESSRVWKDLREAGKLARAALATPKDAP